MLEIVVDVFSRQIRHEQIYPIQLNVLIVRQRQRGFHQFFLHLKLENLPSELTLAGLIALLESVIAKRALK